MKNRIKNIRKITVYDDEYKWLVQMEEYGNHLKIWDSNKSLVIEGKDMNPNIDITPSFIVELIKEEYI